MLNITNSGIVHITLYRHANKAMILPEIDVEDPYSDDHTQGDQDHGEQQVLKGINLHIMIK